jgi:hypothetical protein
MRSSVHLLSRALAAFSAWVQWQEHVTEHYILADIMRQRMEEPLMRRGEGEESAKLLSLFSTEFDSKTFLTSGIA